MTSSWGHNPIRRRQARASSWRRVPSTVESPPIRPKEARDHSDGGGFSGAVRTQEAEDLTPGYIQGKVPDGFHVPKDFRSPRKAQNDVWVGRRHGGSPGFLDGRPYVHRSSRAARLPEGGEGIPIPPVS